ncbi:MAG: chorismate mutase, partial [Promethearchaeota archaeon]
MKERDDLEEELKRLREEIDQLDDKLVELLNKRGNIVIQIGKLKEKLKLKVFQPEREKEVIERLSKKSTAFQRESI